jgi:hypothetical protein
MKMKEMMRTETAEYLQFLLRDKFFAALSQEKRTGHLKKIEGFSVEKARWFSRRFAPLHSDAELKAAAVCLGIRILDVHDSVHIPRLAEYEAVSRTIRLYREKIGVVENLLKRIFPAMISGYSLCALCLAHEIFHHIEHISLGATGRVVTVPAKLLWVIPVRRTVAGASEVAAHLFVKELLNLEYSPVFINTVVRKPEFSNNFPGKNKQLEDVYV